MVSPTPLHLTRDSPVSTAVGQSSWELIDNPNMRTSPNRFGPHGARYGAQDSAIDFQTLSDPSLRWCMRKRLLFESMRLDFDGPTASHACWQVFWRRVWGKVWKCETRSIC